MVKLVKHHPLLHTHYKLILFINNNTSSHLIPDSMFVYLYSVVFSLNICQSTSAMAVIPALNLHQHKLFLSSLKGNTKNTDFPMGFVFNLSKGI